jgi:hypothetical protein
VTEPTTNRVEAEREITPNTTERDERNSMGICWTHTKGWESDGKIRYMLNYDITDNIINISVNQLYLELNRMNTWDAIRTSTVINATVDINTIINEKCPNTGFTLWLVLVDYEQHAKS